MKPQRPLTAPAAARIASSVLSIGLLAACLVASVASVTACGARQTPGDTEEVEVEESGDVTEAIAGVVELYRQAYETQSIETLGGLYSADFDLVVTFQGKSFAGWGPTKTFLEGRFMGATKVRLVVKDLAVASLGEGAVVAHARLEFSIGDDATTVTEKGIVTWAFQQRGSDWKIVAEHFSYPTGPS